jgi:hypothetical protein
MPARAGTLVAADASSFAAARLNLTAAAKHRS